MALIILPSHVDAIITCSRMESVVLRWFDDIGMICDIGSSKLEST